jgi:hypothetical protein
MQFFLDFGNALGTQLDEGPDRAVLKIRTENTKTACFRDHGSHRQAQAALGEHGLEACIHPEQTYRPARD